MESVLVFSSVAIHNMFTGEKHCSAMYSRARFVNDGKREHVTLHPLKSLQPRSESANTFERWILLMRRVFAHRPVHRFVQLLVKSGACTASRPSQLYELLFVHPQVHINRTLLSRNRKFDSRAVRS